MDQPETRNALTPELLAGLKNGIADAVGGPGTRVIVLTHSGPAWCAGADLKRRPPPSAAGTDRPVPVGVGELPAILQAIADAPVPVVARLAGHAMGGGVGLAAACDLSVAADDVRFGFTEVRLGVIPAVISVVCLPKLRRGDALELFLTGERIPAERAAAAGLITRAVPLAHLDATVERIVGLLLQGAPRALAEAKALVYRDHLASGEEAYASMIALSARLFASDEGIEGRSAFVDKRPASWVPGSS